jgi:hypothetical protein
MRPTPVGRATLVDLLDRALDKGVVLNLDLIICVADVPLLGVNLKAALAGIETMLEYGIMADWDEAHRAWARENREPAKATKGFTGSLWSDNGIYKAWVSCAFERDNSCFMFTDFQGRPLLKMPICDVTDIYMEKRKVLNTKEATDICFVYNSGKVLRFHPKEEVQQVYEYCLFVLSERRDAFKPAKTEAPAFKTGVSESADAADNG